MFTPIKPKKIYQLIVEQIQDMIMTGELKSGDKLPSERSLAEQFDASRSSIREAMRSLEILGVLESRQGEGNFVRDTTDGEWLEPISVMFKLSNGTFEEILEMRMIIETESAALAAVRMNKEERRALKAIMDGIRVSDSEEERAALDQDFHVMLAKGSKNILIMTVMQAINTILKNFIEEARKSINVWSAESDLLLEQHQNICNAVILGQSEQAREAMNVHFDLVVKSRNSSV